MNKIISFVLTALVAIALVEDVQSAATPAAQPLIPQVATFCKNGCPEICSAAEELCKASPNMDAASCPDLKTDCDSECGKLCTCVEGCGPSCEAFEANCEKDSAEPIQQFCPFNGGVCDVTCVIGCSQELASNALQKLFSDDGEAFKIFVTGLLAAK